tara:strand:+ start:15 stop:614 length:600 start_codon:yes stop_codon:yes gene_type:complete
MDKEKIEEKEKIHKYIKKYTKKGYPKNSLTDVLSKFGYSKSTIKECFKEVKVEKPKLLDKLKEKEEIFLDLFTKWYTFAFLTVLFLIIIITFAIFSLSNNCEYDKDCFIQNALESKSTKVYEEVAGSILEYSFKEGRVVKEFVDFSEDEPEEVVVLLKNKKVVCEFDEFTPELVDGLFGGVEYCEGELLNIIYELRIIS